MVMATAAERRIRERLEREEEERSKAKSANLVPVSMPPAPEKLAFDMLKALEPDLKGVEIFGNRILVAKFIRERIGISGRLYAATDTKREDNYQGKIGLVVKVGPTAFQDDEASGVFWHGDHVKVGDWVLYSYSDGYDFDLCPAVGGERVRCKILREGEIAGIVPRPDLFL